MSTEEIAVSYTHLDVYKRQTVFRGLSNQIQNDLIEAVSSAPLVATRK